MVHERIVAFVTVLVIAGCSGGVDPSHSTGNVPRTETTGVRLPILPAGGDSIHVAAVGTLEVDGPCLYLRASDDTRTLPLFAIEGIRWIASEKKLEAGGRSYRLGQTVTLTGNPADALPSELTWVQAPDTRCNAQRVFIASAIQ
jgi:hypothetical protein